MDTRLNSFLTVCDTMNYRKAAELLHLSQPAVTKQIQSLENEYGIKLFYFDGKKLNRSEKSYLLEIYANSQKANYENILKKLSEKESKTLKIGFTKTIGEFTVLEEIIRYIDNNEANLELVIDNTEKLLCSLKNNDLDFILVEGNFDKEYFDYKLISKEFFTGICSNEHPFANKNIDIDDIYNSTLIIRERGSGSREIFENLLNLQGNTIEKFNKIISVSSVNLITQLVVRNKGISFGYEKIKYQKKELSTFCVKELSYFHDFNMVSLKGTGGLDKAENFLKTTSNK